MTNSKKSQIAIVLVLTCNVALWSAEEPNDAEPQIKIEVSNVNMVWAHDSSSHGRGPVKPTHGVEAIVGDQSRPPLRWESFLNTSAAASMSPKQRQFIEGSDAFAEMGPSTEVRNHKRIFLYAVSEEDARNMIKALIEILEERPNRRRLEYTTRLREDKEEMVKAKGLLPGKEALLPSVKAEYDKRKESAHPFTADTEAAEQAKQTIIEMGKMLDTLDVELAGIREKLKVINDYWSRRGEMSEAACGKLQEMEIEQTVELKGAEARRKAAVAIRQREKDFFDLYDQWLSLDSEVNGLRIRICSREEEIAQIEEMLANPKPDILPPKIYQDKVVIYRVAEQDNAPGEE